MERAKFERDMRMAADRVGVVYTEYPDVGDPLLAELNSKKPEELKSMTEQQFAQIEGQIEENMQRARVGCNEVLTICFSSKHHACPWHSAALPHACSPFHEQGSVLLYVRSTNYAPDPIKHF
jgi:hypothetical protein